MTLKREDVLTILAQNVAIRGSAFPISSSALTSWAEGLGLKKGGHTVIYTGHMYQIIPYILGMQQREKALPKASWGMRLARLINPVVNLTRVITLRAAHPLDLRRYNQVLRDVVSLLRASQVEEFGYLYEYEDYAGALAYDMGLDKVFHRHAQRVYQKLKNFGVRRLITVDPHTTDMFKNVYPKILGDFDIEVVSYLELLAESWKANKSTEGQEGPFVIHDSCVYARYLGVYEAPRELLKRAGIPYKEPLLSKKLTHCCGGPIESLFPEKARQIAQERLDGLAPLGKWVITMCPICHLNLGNAADQGVKPIDIATVLNQIQKP